MSRLKKTLNDLIVSLEGFTDQPLSNDDVNDLGNQFKEIEKAEISLEAYCNAYNLCNMLNESNTLSMESYSAIMTLAESNKSIPACLNISLEDETSPSMLKNIKDKVVAAFKFLMEKVRNFSKLVGEKIFALMDKTKKSAQQLKDNISNGAKIKETVIRPDFFLIIDKDGIPYKPSLIENAIEFFFETLRNEIVGVLMDSFDNVKNLREKDYKFFSNESMKHVTKELSNVSQKVGTSDFNRVNGTNVLVSVEEETGKVTILTQAAQLEENGVKLFDGNDISTSKYEIEKLGELADLIIKLKWDKRSFLDSNSRLEKRIKDVENDLIDTNSLDANKIKNLMEPLNMLFKTLFTCSNVAGFLINDVNKLLSKIELDK